MNTAEIHWRRLMLGLLACLVATGCGLCERDTRAPNAGAAQLAERISADVDAAFFVNDWKDLRDGALVLERHMGQNAPIEPLMAQLKATLGVDPRDMASVQSKGVRTSGGLAVSILKNNATLYIPLESPKIFEQYLQTLGKEKLGAEPQPRTKQIDGHTLYQLVRQSPDGKSPEVVTPDALLMAWVVVDNVALLFPGQEMMGNNGDAEIALTSLVKLDPTRALARNPEFVTLKDKLSKDHPIFGVANLPKEVAARADELAEFIHSRDAAESYKAMAADLGLVGVGLSLSDKGARLHVQSTMRGALKGRVDTAATALAGAEGMKATLDGAPAFVLKLAFHPEKGIEELRSVMGEDSRMLATVLGGVERMFKIDFEKQLLPALDGNLMLVTYDVAASTLRSPDPAALLTRTRSAITLGLRDPKALIATMDQMVANGGAFIKRQDDGDAAVFIFADTTPMATLAVVGKVAVLGSAKLDPAEVVRLARGQGGGPAGVVALPAAAPLLTGPGTSGLVLDPMLFDQMAGGAGSPLASILAIVLRIQPAELGPILDLEVLFKETPVGGEQKTKAP